MALVTLIDKVTEVLDKEECIIGVFFDFSKAFDTVDHDILLQKLTLHGIQDIMLKWFKGYLSNRVQFVTYNGLKSMREKIKCGVPQGSILGPLLFLMYINDLCRVSEFFLPLLFVDDTNLFITGNDMEEMCAKLNGDLKNISEWLCCNKLSLNVSKTHYMVFSPRNKIINNIDVSINNTTIERVYDFSEFKLMLNFHGRNMWSIHVINCQIVGLILKARKKLHKAALVTLYYSFAYPYLIYCNLVWGNTYSTNLEKINRLQKKLVRIITNSPYRAHTAPLQLANRLLSVSEINSYIVGMFMYNSINGILSSTFF